MNDSDDKIDLVWLAFAAIILFLLFSPPIAFSISVFGLAIIRLYNSPRNFEQYFFVFLFGAFFSTLIAATSHPVLIYEESDFTTYYQNYLVFYKYGLTADFFEYFKFGSPIEIGIPALHYIFSLVIDAPYPYMVKLFHAFLQLSLLTVVVLRISNVYLLSFRDTSLLFSLTFLFYKFGATLNHLAQGYSSFFILLAVFSKRNASLWVVCALLFHFSALFIYPLISFLIKSVDNKKLMIFNVICIFFSIFIFSFITVISDLVVSSGPLLGKLIWAFSGVMDYSQVIQSLKTAIIACMYLLPLLIINIISLFWSKFSLPMSANIFSMFIFILAFSYLPGISVRVMAPVLTILFGFLYFISLFHYVRFKQFKILLVFMMVFFPLNWIFRSELYFYIYPLASFEPMYYVDAYFLSNDGEIRSSLPSKEDFEIINPYR